MTELRIDPEFEKIIPPLTEEEFQQLQTNILAEGEVFTPIFTWNGLIVDGHHRHRVIRQHPEIRYQVSEREFENRYAAISWICNNQLRRRNLNDIQKTVLIGRRYEAEKLVYGDRRSEAFEEISKGQNVLLKNTMNVTTQLLADEMGINEKNVRRAGDVVAGLDATEEVVPGIGREILSGAIKPTKQDIAAVAKAPPEERKQLAENLRNPQEKQPRPKTRQETRELYRSIDEISARLAAPKTGNDIENVLGIIQGAAEGFQNTCEFYLDEFPELLSSSRPLLREAIDGLHKYIITLYGGTPT